MPLPHRSRPTTNPNFRLNQAPHAIRSSKIRDVNFGHTRTVMIEANYTRFSIRCQRHRVRMLEHL